MMLGSFGLPELLILLVFGLGGLLWVWMLIEAATLEAAGSQDRLIWVLIIIFTHFLGAAVYFFVRRPARKAALGR